MRRTREWALIGLVAIAAALGGYAFNAWRTAPDGAAGATPEAQAALMSARFPDLNQTPQPLDQWRGKVVVINFWATWCAPCREEIPLFVRLQEAHRDRGLQFVGIAIDQPAAVRPFPDELRMNFPVLIAGIDAIDMTRKLGNRAGVLPYTVVIDRQGRVVALQVGAVKEGKLVPLLESLL